MVKCGLRLMEVREHNACPPLLTDDSTGLEGGTNRGFRADDDDGSDQSDCAHPYVLN